MPDYASQAPAWDMVPGALDTAMMAFERRPGVLHCNTYLLKTSEYVIIIDPGADEQHALATGAVAGALAREMPRQTAICLTHCHLDHCAQAGRIIAAGLPEATVVCHSAGADALRGKDPELTLATLTALDIPELGDIYALFAGPGPTGVSRAMDTPGGGLRSLSIPIGPRDALQVYHTPGHSPDSVCFRVGGALFAGDLPFAAGPGLVDLPGWDGAQLAASLEKILWLLDHCNITTVLPGHGRALSRLEARRVITDMLDGLFGRAHRPARDAAAFPRALLHASSALLAKSGQSLAPAPLIRDAAPDGREAAALPHSRAMHIEAAQLARRLDDLPVPKTPQDSANARHTRRARRRLGDFLCSLHGFRFADHAGAAEINHTVAELLAELAGLPHFTGFALRFQHAVPAPEGRMDAEVLADLVETALEAYKDTGAAGAAIGVELGADTVAVSVATAQPAAALSGTLAAYLRLSMEAYGCSFDSAPGRTTFTMPLVRKDQ